MQKEFLALLCAQSDPGFVQSEGIPQIHVSVWRLGAFGIAIQLYSSPD